MWSNLSSPRNLRLGIGLLLIPLFTLVAAWLYTVTERRLVATHSDDQELLVRTATQSLELQMDSYRHQAETLAQYFSNHAPKEWNGILQTLHLAQPIVNVIVMTPDGEALWHSTPTDAEAWQSVLNLSPGLPVPFLTSPFPLTGSERLLTLVVALDTGSGPSGLLGVQFPARTLERALLPDVPAGLNLGLSLIDERGTVLLHTEHPEMVGRTIPKDGASCLPCHSTFATEKLLLEGGTEAEVLEIEGRKTLLVGHGPVSVLGRRWTLTLTEPYQIIIADARKGFLTIIILLMVLLGLSWGSLVAILRSRWQRARAEERARAAERRAVMEHKVRHAEQLASIGKMTSQVAHQVNTPLATLALNVAFLQSEAERHLGSDSKQIRDVCRDLAREIERLKHVVNDYLRFSRLPEAHLGRGSVREAVEELVEFCRVEANQRNIRVDARLADGPSYVELDPDLFRQAFLNLVRNSFEAMPEGGTLTLLLESTAEGVTLRLQDTGPGIPEEIRSRILEPFFTTKKQGTGLGLAYAAQIIEKHGGNLTCGAAPGGGAEFIIRLPAVRPVTAELEKIAV